MSTINLDVNGTYTANINASITFSPGVTHIAVTAIGGGGGQGNYSTTSIGGAGGGGGSVTSNFNVNSTDTLSLYIGLPGSGGGGGFTGFATNDFSGGGGGGYSNNAGAGGGGAATCVTLTRSSLSFVLLVAGGGGGGSIASTFDGSNGGYGGGNEDGDGSSGIVSSGSSGGGGLRDGTGGTGGSPETNGTTGLINDLTGAVTVGNGGGGASGNGGGGGGGFGGGGGNNVGGGGGGSSFVNTNFNIGFESSVSYSYVTTTYNDSSVTPLAGSGGYIGDQSLGSGASGFHGQVIITAFGDPPTPGPGPGPAPASGNSVDQTCFRKGTRILTADSRYVNVEKLKTGDVLFTSNGPKDIVDIIRFTSSFDKHPLYVLPKHILGINAPNRDLYMSNNHAFKHNGLWHHMKCSRVTKLLPIKEIDYYHISLGNYFNYTIVAENIEVESCFVYKLDDMTIASWECNKVCCQPLKITKVVEPKLHFTAERIDLPGKLDPGKLDGDKKGKDKGKEKGKGKVRLNEIDQISLKKEFRYNESMYNNNESMYNKSEGLDTYQTNGSHKQGHKQTSIEKFMNTTQKFRF